MHVLHDAHHHSSAPSDPSNSFLRRIGDRRWGGNPGGAADLWLLPLLLKGPNPYRDCAAINLV